jgi:hypothetical protein
VGPEPPRQNSPSLDPAEPEATNLDSDDKRDHIEEEEPPSADVDETLKPTPDDEQNNNGDVVVAEEDTVMY